MDSISDASLVQQAQQGDVTAVGRLYDRYHEPMHRFIWSRVADPDLAGDLTGELFLRVVRGLPAYVPGGKPFPAWLFRIARNLIVDHYRQVQRRPTVPLETAQQVRGEGESLGMVIDRSLTLSQLQAAMQQIDPAQREVIELRFVLGLSLQDVAVTLDKTVAAVKSLQHRGLKALRACLLAQAAPVK